MIKRIVYIGVILVFVFSLTACGSVRENQKFEKDVNAMDTMFHMEAYGAKATKALETAQQTIYDYAKRFSVTNPTGDLGKWNESIRRHKGQTTSGEVSRELSELLTVAFWANTLTNQSFDITIYPVVSAWGFTTEKYQIPDEETLQEALAQVGMEALQLEDGVLTVSSQRTMDLGGITKGYTGYKLCEQMKKQGVISAILSLGGNIQTIGTKPDGSLWKVGITDPADPNSYLGTVKTGETSVITSGTYQRYFEENGIRYHHIMNPSNGKPASNTLQSVTVIGKNGTLGDALSTGLFVMGEEQACDLWRTWKKSEDKTLRSLELILISKDNRVMITEGLADSFTLTSNDYTQEVITKEVP